MSYETQWLLVNGDPFANRCRAAITQRSAIFKDDERAGYVALAESLLKNDNAAELTTFLQLLANAPGFGDKVDNGDGTIDSSKIEDAEIQAAIDAGFPTMVDLYFPPSDAPAS